MQPDAGEVGGWVSVGLRGRRSACAGGEGSSAAFSSHPPASACHPTATGGGSRSCPLDRCGMQGRMAAEDAQGLGCARRVPGPIWGENTYFNFFFLIHFLPCFISLNSALSHGVSSTDRFCFETRCSVEILRGMGKPEWESRG